MEKRGTDALRQLNPGRSREETGEDSSPGTPLSDARAMQENTFSLTQPLRQDPQEIQGSSLDADTAHQHRAQAAACLGAGGC